MTKPNPQSRSSDRSCCEGDQDCCLPRREFVKLLGAGAAAVAASGRSLPVMAGPFPGGNKYLEVIPQDKRLDPAWVRSLYERGEKQTYTGEDLKFIGMPVGGIGSGHVYLGGDGRLWLWDIFNQNHGRGLLSRGAGGETYLNPLEQLQRFEQGFEIITGDGDETIRRSLDGKGFAQVTFDGRYPMGIVTYRDPACPVEATLEAFSPFIPLDLENSSYPATILHFTLRNTSDGALKVTLAGRAENPVCLFTGSAVDTLRRNSILRRDAATILQCSAERPVRKEPPAKVRPDVVFEDFEKPTYKGWTVEGQAFGSEPVRIKDIPDYQGNVAGAGERVVNSHASAPGEGVGPKDAATGTLTSEPFTIERRFISFLVGGGSHRGTCIELLVDGKSVSKTTGKNNNVMHPAFFDVVALEGKTAQLRIADQVSGPWGNVGVDQIVFTDTRPQADAGALEQRHDFGTLALALVGGAVCATASGSSAQWFAEPTDTADGPFGEPLVGAVGRSVELKPGESATVTFVFAWHFPNLELPHVGRSGRWYTARFDDAAAVAEHVAANLDELAGATRRWVDTWYDSTLPYWLLDRAMANTSTLATNTCFLFENGRFYGWEGVACCPGTCTHVWHYAQAPGRLFPEIERRTREMVDFDLGLYDNGAIAHRTYAPGNKAHHADDGQCGRILGVLREHQMSADDAFLRNLWPKVKLAVEFMISRDPNQDGILDGPQPNTLDAAWFGEISFTSSLYLAALRAGAEMAREMDNDEFARKCDQIADAGSRQILELFNGEYFIQKEDPRHAGAIGVGPGCYIDQVFGQTWAHWVGLGRLFDREKQLSALRSLWKYNFVPDVGPFREQFPRGRWYAKAGDAGLIMCSWPKEPVDPDKKKHWQYMYFNECMTGFEWQAAAHMVYEGADEPDLLEYGLAISRAIHDRYDASLRNPYNEIECSDHYARAMASYGVFQAICGFTCHGPHGEVEFAPRLTPERFKAPWVGPEGWGSFSQRVEGGRLIAEIDARHGSLGLKTLTLGLPKGVEASSVETCVDDKQTPAKLQRDGQRVTVDWPEKLRVRPGQQLKVTLT